MAEQMMGGWTPFNYELSAADKAVFHEALEGFVGVKYIPSACATQVVAGTNYCFLCSGDVISPSGHRFPAKVYIFKPLNGQAHISEIVRIQP